MSSGGGGGSSGRPSVLADRSLRENARVDMDEDQEHRRSPFSSPAVGSARHAGGGGGGSGHSKAAAAAVRPRDCRRRSLNERWGSLVVAGESGREEISLSPATVSGKTPRDRRDCADPARGNGLPPPPPPEKDGAAVPSETGAARRASGAVPGEESPAIGTGSPGEVGAGSDDFLEVWDDGGGMYDDYGDDFGSGGVYTYSPSPPRSSAAASAAGMGSGSSSVRSSFGDPVSSGNSSCNARDSAGGKSAASSPVDTSHVLDLSASSTPPLPQTSRFSKQVVPPKSPTVASGNRKGQASARLVVCSDDDDDFVDCLEVEGADKAIPAGRNGGARDRGWSGSGPKKPPSKNGSFGGSGSGGGGGRFALGNSGSLAGGPAARQPSKSLGRGQYSSSNSSSEDDDSDGFSMVVSTKRRGSCAAAHTAGASAGTFAGRAAGRTGLGDGGRYGDLVVGAAGEWRREAGGEAWKMAASGGGGNASGGRESDDDESHDYELPPRKKKEAFSVPAELYNRMYAHQRIGVRWLWSLHQGDMGGILGDDMGLGKTFQVTCFLAGLFGTRQAKSALVLAPKSVMRGWEDELGRWLVKAACPKAEVRQEVVVMASEMPAKARRRAIALAAEGGSRGRGAVLITTYGMVSSNPKQFAPAVGGSGGWIERGEPRQHVWDYVILDEGHKIKNASTK
ncbi:unnamed protein product [Ectocarpus sp. CCAP 1310/34]|nr:unnamed protein product [Ectocarpus sp. CCAP 1310/34]